MEMIDMCGSVLKKEKVLMLSDLESGMAVNLKR